MLAIAALAICAVAAAMRRQSTSTPPPAPTSPHPGTTGRSRPDPLTVAEVKRLFNLLTRTMHELAHHLRWACWRRRHQARGRWYHHRALLQRQTNPP